MASNTMNNSQSTNEVLNSEASNVNSKLSADEWKNVERKLNDFKLSQRFIDFNVSSNVWYHKSKYRR